MHHCAHDIYNHPVPQSLSHQQQNQHHCPIMFNNILSPDGGKMRVDVAQNRSSAGGSDLYPQTSEPLPCSSVSLPLSLSPPRPQHLLGKEEPASNGWALMDDHQLYLSDGHQSLANEDGNLPGGIVMGNAPHHQHQQQGHVSLVEATQSTPETSLMVDGNSQGRANAAASALMTPASGSGVWEGALFGSNCEEAYGVNPAGSALLPNQFTSMHSADATSNVCLDFTLTQSSVPMAVSTPSVPASDGIGQLAQPFQLSDNHGLLGGGGMVQGSAQQPHPGSAQMEDSEGKTLGATESGGDDNGEGCSSKENTRKQRSSR
eukprot:gene6723-8045_t